MVVLAQLYLLVIPEGPWSHGWDVPTATDTAFAVALIVLLGQRGGEVLRHGPSLPTLRAIDAIHDRLESPADRLLRYAGARSSRASLEIIHKQ
jgi:hypothetical protein